MPDWDAIHQEAEKMVDRIKGIDLSVVKETIDYFIARRYDRAAVEKYLQLMSTNPPRRSNNSRKYYQSMRDVWKNLRTKLSGADLARALAWAERLARVERWR